MRQQSTYEAVRIWYFMSRFIVPVCKFKVNILGKYTFAFLLS